MLCQKSILLKKCCSRSPSTFNYYALTNYDTAWICHCWKKWPAFLQNASGNPVCVRAWCWCSMLLQCCSHRCQPAEMSDASARKSTMFFLLHTTQAHGFVLTSAPQTCLTFSLCHWCWQRQGFDLLIESSNLEKRRRLNCNLCWRVAP